jgi:hypothetical protein
MGSPQQCPHALKDQRRSAFGIEPVEQIHQSCIGPHEYAKLVTLDSVDHDPSRLTRLLMLRYRHDSPERVHRVACVCLETVKAITGLAVASGKIDHLLVAELKALLSVYIRARLGNH